MTILKRLKKVNITQLFHLPNQRKEVKVDNIEDQLPSFSPVPPKEDKVVQTLHFLDALKQVIDGKRITKFEWADQHIYGVLADGRLRIMLKDGLKDWILSDGDLNGNDWIVLP